MPEVEFAEFLTHDNGGRPFRVEVHRGGTRVKVFRQVQDSDTYEATPLLVEDALQTFVGKSPILRMTTFSGGFGSAFDGNSILFHSAKNASALEYVHVGTRIRRFRAKAPIVEFVSPVGNNDVPYPHAVDTARNTYLLIEDVVLSSASLTQRGSSTPASAPLLWGAEAFDDPYDYFYVHNMIVNGGRNHRRATPPSFQGLAHWWWNGESCMMRYHPSPEKDYDRLTRDYPCGCDGTGCPEGCGCDCHRDKEMAIQYAGQDAKVELTKILYVAINTAFGAFMGFSPMELIE